MAKTKGNKEDFKSYKNSLSGVFAEIVAALTENERIYSELGKVTAINELEKTCTIQISDGEELEGVRMQQVPSDLGLFIKPKINSTIIVSWTDNTTAFVSLYSEIDEIVFQNGVNGGLTITPTLATNLNKSNSYSKALKAATKGIAVALDALVPGTSAAFEAAMLGQEVGDFSAIENDKFKH